MKFGLILIYHEIYVLLLCKRDWYRSYDEYGNEQTVLMVVQHVQTGRQIIGTYYCHCYAMNYPKRAVVFIFNT